MVCFRQTRDHCGVFVRACARACVCGQSNECRSELQNSTIVDSVKRRTHYTSSATCLVTERHSHITHSLTGELEGVLSLILLRNSKRQKKAKKKRTVELYCILFFLAFWNIRDVREEK